MESHKDNSIREDLAFTYRLFARNGWDDLTYTHLTVRSRQGDSFYIIKFGLLFDEVTPDNLIQVDLLRWTHPNLQHHLFHKPWISTMHFSNYFLAQLQADQSHTYPVSHHRFHLIER